MRYPAIRDDLSTGDLMLVEGRGLIGTLIRVLTGQQFSHVAMLFRQDDGVWIAEMREGVGFRITPASQWLVQTKGLIYWGKAPGEVRISTQGIEEAIFEFRADPPAYSYWSLVSVWLSQLFRRRLPAGLVCSTFVQEIWTECGMRFNQTADPGDFASLCVALVPVNKG